MYGTRLGDELLDGVVAAVQQRGSFLELLVPLVVLFLVQDARRHRQRAQALGRRHTAPVREPCDEWLFHGKHSDWQQKPVAGRPLG